MSIHGADLPLCSRAKSQLLLINVQERLASSMPVDEMRLVSANVERLGAAASRLEIPVIVTEHYSKGLGPTLASVMRRLPSGTETKDKTVFSCCTAPGFEEDLKRHEDRKQLILVGLEAHICVLQTASGLQQWGYQVFVVEDAVCSRDSVNRKNAIQRMRRAGIQVTNAESVAFEWIGDASDERFKEVQALFR